jgi:RNA polymerase sigma factor (sigma-70 family)
MMDTETGEEPPPRSTDLEGWRQAVANGRFREFKAEAIVAAIQDLGPTTDKIILNPLVLHVSLAIMRILRKRVGRNHRNQGEDIIDEAHGHLIEALFKPKSADGKGLREAFVPRIQFRAADAIRAEQKRKERESSTETNEILGFEGPRRNTDPRQELDEQIDVEDVLSHVTDERKRLAFRLHMEGYPSESKRSASIAEAVGVSAKTARQWIEEVQALLRNIVGEKS